MNLQQRRGNSNAITNIQQYTKKRNLSKTKSTYSQNGTYPLERMILVFVCLVAGIIAGSFVYQITVLQRVTHSSDQMVPTIQQDPISRLRKQKERPVVVDDEDEEEEEEEGGGNKAQVRG